MTWSCNWQSNNKLKALKAHYLGFLWVHPVLGYSNCQCMWHHLYNLLTIAHIRTTDGFLILDWTNWTELQVRKKMIRNILISLKEQIESWGRLYITTIDWLDWLITVHLPCSGLGQGHTLVPIQILSVLFWPVHCRLGQMQWRSSSALPPHLTLNLSKSDSPS